MLDLGAYLLAAAELIAIAAALAFGAVRLRAALMPTFEGSPARLAEAVLALSTLLLVCEALGLVGLFEEIPLLVGAIAAGLAQGFAAPPIAARLGPEPPADPPERAPDFGGRPLQLTIAVGISAAAFAMWAMPTIDALGHGIWGFDSQWYHLPFAARFAETGEIWGFHHTTPVLLSWFYPANSELLDAAGMVVTGRDILSPVLNIGWLALALLAAWCLGRPWGVGGFAVLGAFLMLGAGVFADQAGEARNDAMALALILSTAALLAQRPAAVGASALAAGLALGTRLTSLGPVAALTVGVIAIARRGRRLAVAGVWIAGLLLTGGFWYLRNLVEVGNPLPQVMSLGPIDLPGPDQALGGRPSFSVAHYLTDFGVWGDWFAPALKDAFGLLWPLVLALAVGGAVLAIARGPSRAVRMLGAIAIATMLVYVVTPVTASGPEGQPLGFGPNLRYLAPGLVLGLALLPVALSGYAAKVQIGGAAALGFAAVPAALSYLAEVEGGAAVWLGVLVGLAAALVIGLANQVQEWNAAAFAGVAAVAIAVIAAGYFAERRYFDERYVDTGAIGNPALEAVFDEARDIHDSRIATDTTRQFPLYGLDLSNHVQFVGIERPEGGFVAATDCEAWRRAVDAGDYDYVVTALDRVEPDGTQRPPEYAWVASSASAEKVFDEDGGSIFELSGPLDPSACADDLAGAGR